jgi:hypothetical protein
MKEDYVKNKFLRCKEKKNKNTMLNLDVKGEIKFD